MQTMTRRAAGAAVVLAMLVGKAAGQTASWLSALDGDWEDPANWDTNDVPNSTTESAALGLIGPYSVFLTSSRTIDALSILNPDATLEINPSRALGLAGSVLQNDGTIWINPAGSVFDTKLTLLNTASITGAGTILLGAASGSGSFADAKLEAGAPSAIVTIGPAQTVRGNGQLAGTGFINEGLILGDDPAGPGIQINAPVTQTGAGRIDVTNGSVSTGSLASITGGEIFGTGAGSFRITSSPIDMSDVTLNGPLGIEGSKILLLEGPLENNNTITINDNNTVFNAVLSFNADTAILGTGTIRMQTNGAADDAQIRANGVTGTIGAGQAVIGGGQIQGTISLLGSMTADHPSTDLVIQDTVSGPGVLRAIGDSRLAFSSAVVSDLTLETADNGIIAAENGSTDVSGLTNTGNMGIAGGATTLSIVGDLTNNGLLTINYSNTVFNAFLRFNADASILGTGDIRMITSGSLGDAQIIASAGFTGTLGAGQTVAGSGQIDGSIVNLGVINGDDPAATLEILGDVTGQGVIRSDDGKVLVRSGSIADQTVETSGSGIVSADGFSTMADIVSNGAMGIDGSSATMDVFGSFENNGTYLINATDQVFNAVMRLNDAAGVSGTGTIIMETAGSFADAQISVVGGVASQLGTGQTLTGSGQLRGELAVRGTIDPAGDDRAFDAQAATLTMSSFTHTRFDLGGQNNGEFDRFNLNGASSIDLAGSVEIAVDAGYGPLFGDTWDVIGGASGATVTGTFDSYDLPAAPPTLAYRVFYESNRVFVRLTCAADFNGDAAFNFFDISSYIDLYNAGDPRADLAAPFGAFNFFDIATFISIYNAGCN